MAIARIFASDGGTAGGKKEQTKNLADQIGSDNQSFDIGKPYKTGSLRVYWNGIRQTTGTTITEQTGRIFTTQFVAHPGDSLIVDYQPL